jgi:hypothetical protein
MTKGMGSGLCCNKRRLVSWIQTVYVGSVYLGTIRRDYIPPDYARVSSLVCSTQRTCYTGGRQTIARPMDSTRQLVLPKNDIASIARHTHYCQVIADDTGHPDTHPPDEKDTPMPRLRLLSPRSALRASQIPRAESQIR